MLELYDKLCVLTPTVAVYTNVYTQGCPGTTPGIDISAHTFPCMEEKIIPTHTIVLEAGVRLLQRISCQTLNVGFGRGEGVQI